MRKRLGKIAAIFIASMFMVSNLSLPVSAAANSGSDSPDTENQTQREAGEAYTDTSTGGETAGSEESAEDSSETNTENKKKGRLSDFVAVLNGEEGYDFIGFSVSKSQLLGMLDAAKTKTEEKFANASEDKKEELQTKLTGLSAMIGSVSDDENTEFYLTDDAGNLMEDGLLYQSLKLMVGGVSKVDVGADWEKVVKEIYVVNGENGATIYFKNGAFYADASATTKIESIADLDSYIVEKGTSGAIMADNYLGHFGGLFIEKVNVSTTEDGEPEDTAEVSKVRVLFADHEGNIVYDPASSEFKLEDMTSAFAINNHNVTLIDGENQGVLYTDGKALYVDQELSNPVTDIASLGENFSNDSAEGHIGGYTLADSDGVLFADHEGNVVISTDEHPINDDIAVNSLRNKYLEVSDGDSQVRLYSDGEHLYKDPERREEVLSAADMDGDLLADNGGHLSAYYQVDEGGNPLRGEDGRKIAIITADGNFASGTGFSEDTLAASKRYNEVHMYAGEDGSAEAVVYCSDGELFTDTELESIFTGADTVTEDGADYSGMFADLGDKHFGGFFFSDGGEFRTSGGSKLMFAAENGHVTDTSIDSDTEVKALYYRYASTLRSEMYDSYGLLNENYDDLDEDEQEEYELLARMVEEEDRGVGLYADDSKLYKDSELTEEADEIDLPYGDAELARTWYAYDNMTGQDGEVWDNVVMSFEPVMSERIAENEDADEDEDRFYAEEYIAGYIAYNLDGDAIFVVDEDGKIDYNRTDIETEEVDDEELGKLNEMAEEADFDGEIGDGLSDTDELTNEDENNGSGDGNGENADGSDQNSEEGSDTGSEETDDGSGSGEESGSGSGESSENSEGDNSGSGESEGAESSDESGNSSDDGSGNGDDGSGSDDASCSDDSYEADSSGDDGAGDAAPVDDSTSGDDSGSDDDSSSDSGDPDSGDSGSPASMDAAVPDTPKQDGDE